jgi:hypothetical protein
MTGGLDLLGASSVGGFDFGDIAKTAGGLLSSTGGILSSDKGKGKDDVKAAIERQKLEDEKAAAEKKAQALTLVGIAAVAILGTAFYLKRK